MICYGVPAAGGEAALPPPLSARLRRAEGVPADSFEARFPGWIDGEIAALRVYADAGTLLFDGIVDEQTRSADARGRSTELVARSRAALLLDNEAIPQTYYMPSLNVLFARHAAPYGLTEFRGDSRVFGAAYPIGKGTSEWSALAEFCRRYLGVEPSLGPGGVLDASGARPEGLLLLSDRGGIPCLAAGEEQKPCALFSELWIRPARAPAYEPGAEDAAAKARGVRRRRLIAEGEDANRMMKKARAGAYRITVQCPGLIAAAPLTLARVEQPGFERGDLYLAESDLLVSAEGARTRLVLRRIAP